MLRRLAFLVTVFAVIGSIVFVSNASARTPEEAFAICPDGTICLFEHANYDGKYVSFRYGSWNLEEFNFNDRISSFVNDSSKEFCMHEHRGYTGHHFWTSGWGTSWFVGWGWNDWVSSVRERPWWGC
jgi:Peptidase inhibitor family I36